jgi:hypothetical protein
VLIACKHDSLVLCSDDVLTKGKHRVDCCVFFESEVAPELRLNKRSQSVLSKRAPTAGGLGANSGLATGPEGWEKQTNQEQRQTEGYREGQKTEFKKRKKRIKKEENT